MLQVCPELTKACADQLLELGLLENAFLKVLHQGPSFYAQPNREQINPYFSSPDTSVETQMERLFLRSSL